MANSGTVPLETVRKRSQKAVEYYRNTVMPSYQTRPNTAPPTRAQNYDSVENINGIYTSHNGNSKNVKVQKKEKSSVAFQVDESEKQSTVKHNDSFTRGGHRATFHGTNSAKWKSGKSKSKDKATSKSQQTYSDDNRQSHGLYRSNSNLEMDSLEFVDPEDLHNSSMRRDYGSTSSLDFLGTSGDTSFFAMIKDLGHHNLDQRSPAPAQMQEFLRGRIDSTKDKAGLKNNEKVSNGSGSLDKGNDEFDGQRSKSVKLKGGKERKSRSKSITNDTRPGLLNKFRGKPEYENGQKMSDSMHSEWKSEESLRAKAFVHYDCQSLGFDVLSVMSSQKSDSNASKNTSTGASAASGQVRASYAGEKDTPDISTDTDDGDGKSSTLVLSCPYFRNELGGEEERLISLGRHTVQKVSSTNNMDNTLSENSAITTNRSPACCGVSILDPFPTPTGLILPHVVLHRGHVIEYMDNGASYYRHFFYGYDHQNYFGIDENLGPVAISIRKEKVDDRENNLGRADYGYNQFRLIFRTSELRTLRGSISEDAIPASASRLGGSRTTTVKDVIEYVCPELQTSCLKLASSSQKTQDQLLKVDQQGVNMTYKVGIMYCKAGQSSEEDMYNNEHSGPAFEEFLSCIGQKVRLKGFEKYRAQLDNKTDSTGTQSVYTTFNNCEIMFHVSTMLPFTPNNPQQLLRKRHIGNDIVTIVFQEPGALPFTPKSFRSQFQHVFIIVQVHNPCTENVHYSIAVTRSKDVPPFGPHIPENAMFPRSDQFAEFLLAKVINAENAAHRCEKFITMATRTRTEYLKDLANNHVTTTTLESGSKLSKFSLSVKKKEKAKIKVVPDMFASGAIIWRVQVEDVSSNADVDAVLAISSEVLIVQEESTKDVIFTVHCGAIIGWTAQANSIKIYFNQEETILVKPQSGEMEETDEICTRLRAVTPGCQTEDKTLKRNGLGQLGFHINADAIVTDVEKNSFACEVGLLKGSRLVEICKVAAVNLSHEQMVDLLRTSVTVKVTLIPPLHDGTPRGVTTLHTNCRYTSLNTLKAACKATQNVQQRQKEALMGMKSAPAGLSGSHKDLCKTASDSSDYCYLKTHSDMTNSTEQLSMEFLKTEFSSIFGGSNENLYQHQQEISQISSSSSENSFHLRDSLNSNSSLKLDTRDSILSSSSSEFATSPTQKEPPGLTGSRGSQTLPRKPDTPTRGDPRNSPVKSLVPGYRPLATSSLQRGAGLHHAYTDSALSSKTSSSYDEGYNSRNTSENLYRNDEVRHDRSGSRDSGDYQYLSGPRPWNPRPQYNQGVSRRQDPANSSGDSGSYGNSSLHVSDSAPNMASLQSSNYSRKYSAPGGDYSAVQHGNISLELLKQTQNSKYLLSQGQDPGKSGNSSINLSDTSFSSGSSQNSGAFSGPRVHGDTGLYGNNSRDDLTNIGKKRSDISASNSKGRPNAPTHRRAHLDMSPHSSENGSPRSSHRNLSGMSSDESLSSRLRPSVHGKHVKAHSNDQLQEDLKRLIDMDIKNSDLRGIFALNSGDKPNIRLKRTMSEESLHSQKGTTVSPPKDLADLIFSTAPPVPALPKEILQDPKLSPCAMLDNAIAAKARQVLSRRTPASQTQNSVPLPESTASLDWSNLVNVATKAIESTDTSSSKASDSPIKHHTDKSLPQDPGKSSFTGTKSQGNSLHKTQTNASTSSVWRSTVSNPQQRIQELEAKVEQLEADLDKERKENADLEAEVQSLRSENERLQEESQTAAAQLRKFTEWFFQTIDRQ